MVLSELLRCSHFPVSAGLAPSIHKLDVDTDTITRDWGEDPHAIPYKKDIDFSGPDIGEDPLVQAAIVRIWDQFQKSEENCIYREEYDSFVLRLIRVLIPGVEVEHEKMLVMNSWEEDAGGLDRLPFPHFFAAMVRLAKMWCGAQDAAEAASFLEELYARVTVVRITGMQEGSTVSVKQIPPSVNVTFRADDGKDPFVPDCDFGTSVTLHMKGHMRTFQVEAALDNRQKTAGGPTHICWFEETLSDPREHTSVSDGISREWAAVDDIVPMGMAALAALRQLEDECKAGSVLEVDVPADQPEPESYIEALFATLAEKHSDRDSDSVICKVDAAGPATAQDCPSAVIEATGAKFAFLDFLKVALSQAQPSTTILVRPLRRSMLYKIAKLRPSLKVFENTAADAALKGFDEVPGVLGFAGGPKLASLMEVLDGRVQPEAGSDLVKHVRDESLMKYGSLSSLAEAFIAQGIMQDVGPTDDQDDPMEELRHARQRAVFAKEEPLYHTKKFRVPVDGLQNDMTDVLDIARTPPVTLWVFGECDSLGDYKTEVCRRLAKRMGLQWLKPSYVLELAVKTPVKQRTPLMQRCVAQLQRGMKVSIADALRLTHEMISSARCKTNGYVLDFPRLSPADAEEVAAFVARARELSASPEIRVGEVLKDDAEALPPLKPEPAPPPPPKPEGDAEGGEGGDGEGGDGGGDDPPAEEPPPEEPPVEALASEGVEGDAEAEEGEEEAEEEEEEGLTSQEPLGPNSWMDSMPRRLILLTTESDEFAAWKTAQLKRKHEEKERERKRLEEAGEDPPEEEDVEEEELPALPEEEEEVTALFEAKGGDVFAAMEKYIPVPSLEPPPRLPPLPDTSKDLAPEEQNKDDFKSSESTVVKALCDKYKLPLLTLHADGRKPEEIAELLWATSGDFKGPNVPLPVALEGAEGEPKNLLTYATPGAPEEEPVFRQWSLWKQHCPVSLYDKQLKPGSVEFAADYGGRAYMMAGVEQLRRFCAWPKLFLQDAPQINAPGLHLGYVLLSPAMYHCEALIDKLHETYGFDIIDPISLVEKAMQLDAVDYKDPEIEAQIAEDPDFVPPEVDPRQKLFEAEKQALLGGQALGTDTIIRLVADALGVEKNIELVKKRNEELERLTKELEAAQDKPDEPPPEIAVDDDGKPVVAFAEPPAKPVRGFVLLGFPESEEQVKALQQQFLLDIEKIILLKPTGEEPPEPADILMKEGVDKQVPLQAVLASTMEKFEALVGGEYQPLVAEVALQADEHTQFISIRKLIDPFYPVTEDLENTAMEIPDPDEWAPPDGWILAPDGKKYVPDPANPPVEEGEPLPDAPERPQIPWGAFGFYCPVTLKNEFWLMPGQKEFQHVVLNSVYSVCTEEASAAFVAEPERFIPKSSPLLPPPRILVTGPTGSCVDRQCELLSKVYKIPVLRLEEKWLARVQVLVDDSKAAKKRKAEQDALAEAPMVEESAPLWPEGWTPPKPKAEGDEGDEAEVAEADAAEAEPEDDGLGEDEPPPGFESAREALYVRAMRDVLGAHCGACIIDGSMFSDLEYTDDGWAWKLEDQREIRALQALLVKGRRVPDVTIVLKCKNETAQKGVGLDFATIDKEYDARVQEYKDLQAQAEEKGEDFDEEALPEHLKGLNLDEEEKESTRVKTRFNDRKKLEWQSLKELNEKLVACRAPIVQVVADRGQEATHKAVRWHCRRFMEERASLLARQEATKAAPWKAKKLLDLSLALPSRFHHASPMFQDSPPFFGRDDALRYGVHLRSRIYYPRSEAEQEQLLERPQDFIHMAVPSRVAVHPAVVVSGPPLSGKTALAKQLAERTGAVYLSVTEVLDQLCNADSIPSNFSREVAACLRDGKEVPDDSIIMALRQRVAAPDVVTRGWVLDDFPLTEQQAKALTEAGVVPHRVLLVGFPENFIFARVRMLARKEAEARGKAEAAKLEEAKAEEVEEEGEETEEKPDEAEEKAKIAAAIAAVEEETYTEYLEREEVVLRNRITAYAARTPMLRAYYGLNFSSVCDVDGTKSAWAIFDRALKETSAAIAQRLEYYRRTSDGLASPVYGMCFTPQRINASRSPWRQYCPVCLTLNNELLLAKDVRHAVEYKSKIYWTSSAESAVLFLEDPEAYLQVPLPQSTPHVLAVSERRTAPSCQLEEYCPVALVDNKELIKASGQHIIQYQGKYWSVEGKEARNKFLRRPMRYVTRAKLPSKKPPLPGHQSVALLKSLTVCRDGKGLDPSEMLTYMQASVAEVICQALVESGERRLLCPGKSPHESALLFLSKFLRARNSLNTDLNSKKMKQQYEAFLDDCVLPHNLKEATDRKVKQEEDWTSYDTRRYNELCQRFDEIFGPDT